MGRQKYILLHGVMKIGGLMAASSLAVDYFWVDSGEVEWLIACVWLIVGYSFGYDRWKQAEQRYWRHRRPDDEDGGNGATQHAQ